MEDGTLRLFPPMSNRRSFWNADGLGACETVVLLRQQFRLGDQTRQLNFEAQGKARVFFRLSAEAAELF